MLAALLAGAYDPAMTDADPTVPDPVPVDDPDAPADPDGPDVPDA